MTSVSLFFIYSCWPEHHRLIPKSVRAIATIWIFLLFKWNTCLFRFCVHLDQSRCRSGHTYGPETLRVRANPRRRGGSCWQLRLRLRKGDERWGLKQCKQNAFSKNDYWYTPTSTTTDKQTCTHHSRSPISSGQTFLLWNNRAGHPSVRFYAYQLRCEYCRLGHVCINCA